MTTKQDLQRQLDELAALIAALPDDDEYRDVTEADIGLPVEVRDYDGQPWQRAILRTVHPNQSYVFRTNKIGDSETSRFWKMARIRKDTPPLREVWIDVNSVDGWCCIANQPVEGAVKFREVRE